MSTKTVPYNQDAEAAALGCILIDNEAMPNLTRTLQPEHFYELKHRWIYEACIALRERDDPIDLLTLTTELDKRGHLQQVGGAVYISQLMNAVPSALRATNYAKIVIETWRRRQVLDIASDVSRLVYDETEDVDGTLAYIAQRAEDLRALKSREYLSLQQLAETLQPIQWLWHNWIPRGMITLLGAVPGAGKSLVALDIAKRVIHGESFPDGAINPSEGKNVIFVDAEMIPQLISERAKLWKIDTGKLFLMQPNPNDMIDFSKEEYKTRLRNMVNLLKPDLVVIDSLSSVSSKGENNIEDIRTVLAFLSELATNYQVGLILIHHLRKKGNNHPTTFGNVISIDDFRGSSHIIAMSRSVIGLSVVQTDAEPDRNGPRKMEIVKTNLAAYPDPVGCELVPMHPKGVYLKWDNEAPRPYKEPTLVDLCAEWLVNILRDLDNPIEPKEIIDMGEDEGFSRATIYRAKRKLGDKISTLGHRPNTQWEYSTD